MQRFDIRQNAELCDVARLFFDEDIPTAAIVCDGFSYVVEIFDRTFSFDYSDIADSIPQSRQAARLSKIALYDALASLTGEVKPWGALTGVRPTKLVYEALAAGRNENEAIAVMSEIYRVSKKRADILGEIIRAQRGKILFQNEYVNLYVHIPFCPSRCNYCSFVSVPMDKKHAAEARLYVELLCKEIRETLLFLNSRGLKILSAYIGGGTPTALDGQSLDSVLGAIGDVGCEYTCEAGRPDSVTEEKMSIMRRHGVTRICINPQTLNDATLEKIGRRHTAEQFFKAYDIAVKCGVDINCDLIAGLNDETEEDFSRSFDGVKALCPQNITVHSLAKKNGSGIRYDGGENLRTAAMTEYAFSHSNGYSPYYLYRQKRQACNLENVGFAVLGKECINNITTMEETVSVVACGAGAISKYVGGGKIARFANMRDLKLYAERFDEKLAGKLEFFGSLYDSAR